MTERPNIVLLVGEDTGLHLGCYGHPDAHTPYLDQLAREGARYTQAYTVGPVCAPSRCCMVTGCYPWSIGTHHMRSTLLRPPRLFTQELQDAGYFVGWPTKTDFNFQPPTDFASSTDDWLAALPREPFFVYKNFGGTHESMMWDRSPHGGLYADWVRQLPEHLRVDPATVHVPAYLPDVPETRTEIARYFEALALQDLQIGRHLRAIDDAGLRDNTIVIYLTDHGRGLPREKRWCYDAGLHLPLLIRWPGRIAAGSVTDRLVSWVDLAPTFLSMAGVPIPAHYQGTAFLGDAAGPERAYAVSGRDRMDEAFDMARSVCDKRYRYIRNAFPHLPHAQRAAYMENERTMQALRRLDAAGALAPPADVFMQPVKPAEELYDRTTDPEMVRNLADDPALAATLQQLRAALDATLARYGDLGNEPESALIARGLVADRLSEEYRLRFGLLPEPFLSRSGRTCLTREEAESRRPSGG